jgi:acetyl-CoA C-acetyltransferase
VTISCRRVERGLLGGLPLDADAFWLGTSSPVTDAHPSSAQDRSPVSRLENYCATGSEAFRNACYAVASGAYDVAMAIGVEKLKDSGSRVERALGRWHRRALTAPAMFSCSPPPAKVRRREA